MLKPYSHPPIVQCPLCGRETVNSICDECVIDLWLLGAQLPGPEATRAEVLAFAKANNVTVFRCKKADGEEP